MDKVFLSIAEFRGAYGCGKTKTYQLINSGQLERAKVGRRTYITATSAAIFAEQCVSRGTQGDNPLCNIHSDYGPAEDSSVSTGLEGSQEALRAKTAGKNPSGIFS